MIDSGNEFDKFYTEELSRTIDLPLRITENYTVLCCLSSSAVKEAYLLSDGSSAEQFILKKRPTADSDILIAEYGILMSICHPNIPRALCLFVEDDFIYLIRQYFQGSTLFEVVESTGPLGTAEATQMMLSLCHTVKYLHQLSPPLINRDIKPQNIVLTGNRGAALVDFDAARRYSCNSLSDTVCMGSPATAAPEQFGYVQTDIRTDIYAMGIVLIYGLTGSFDPAAAHSIRGSLGRIAAKCTEFAPKDRYKSVDGIMAALRPLVVPPVFKYGAVTALMAACFLAGWHMSLALAPPLDASPGQSSYVIAPRGNSSSLFENPLIDEAVRKSLGIADGRPLTSDDLNYVTSIKILGNIALAADAEFNYRQFDSTYETGGRLTERGSINDLSDLKLLPNLRELAIMFNSIDDISQLKGMMLDSLWLNDNYITDITPIEDMWTLTLLDVSSNPLKSIYAVAGLKSMRHLSATNCYIWDYTAAAGLKSLQYLGLTCQEGTDIKFMTELPYLDNVNVESPSVDNLENIYQLMDICYLRVTNCRDLDLSRLPALDNIITMDFHRCGILDVTLLARYKTLRELYLDENPIGDMTPLSELPLLEKLALGNAPCPLEPLTSMPSLKWLSLSGNQKRFADKLGPVAFDIVY